MRFRLLAVLCVTALMTAPITTSNITTSHVTETDLPEDAVLLNVTRNGGCCQESLGTDSGDQNMDMMSAADDHTEKVFRTVQSRVYRFYIPVWILCGAFSSVTMIIVLRKNNLKSSAEVYIMGITLANLIYVLNYIPLDANYFESVKANRHWRSFYNYYAAFLFPVLYVAIAANAWIAMAFALERLLAILYPFKARIIYSRSRALKVIVFIFTAALLTNGTAFFTRGIRVEIDPLTNETMHRLYYTEFSRNQLVTRIQYCFYAIASVIVPVILLGVFNIAILVSLRTVRRKQLGLKEGMVDSDNNRDVQTKRVLVGYMSAFFVCNIMLATTVGSVAIYGFAVLRKFSLEYKIRLLMSRMLYILNPSINFIVYVCCSRMYRETVKNYLCSRVCSAKKSPVVKD